MSFRYYAKRIAQKVGRRLAKKSFENVLKTGPVKIDRTSNVIIVSQVHQAALHMAISAYKSFLAKMPACRLELLQDGSLNEADIALLEEHFIGCNVTHIDKVELNGCPKGGTWERLMYIQHLTREGYVVQVDSDTLTVGDLTEVRDCIESNRAFTIGSPEWQEPVSIPQIVEYAKSNESNHIQVASEEQLENIKNVEIKRYIRGCSAFAGFPHHSNLIGPLSRFSIEMESLLGDRWKEWGTEQFSSNVLVANCDNPLVLPWPRYQNFGFPFDETLISKPCTEGQISLVHFIGTNRYKKGVYGKLIKLVIASLDRS